MAQGPDIDFICPCPGQVPNPRASSTASLLCNPASSNSSLASASLSDQESLPLAQEGQGNRLQAAQAHPAMQRPGPTLPIHRPSPHSLICSSDQALSVVPESTWLRHRKVGTAPLAYISRLLIFTFSSCTLVSPQALSLAGLWDRSRVLPSQHVR